MKKLLLLSTLLTFLFTGLSYSQNEFTRAELDAYIDANLPSASNITMATLRDVLHQFVSSDNNLTDDNLISAEYSEDALLWHSLYTAADRYGRLSNDGINWTQPILFMDGTTMDLDTNRIINVANPVLPLDAVNQQTVDSLLEATKTTLVLTNITDPAIDEATSTAIIDTSQGVLITLTGAGNNQTLQQPTITTEGREFHVLNSSTSTGNINVNDYVMKPGEFNTFTYDGNEWVGNNITSATTLNINGTALFEGGVLDTVTGDNNTFNIQAGDGIIIDNVTDHEKPTITFVSWAAFNNVNPSFLATQPRSYIGIDINGNPVQASIDFSNEQKRSIIELGSVIHIDNINVSDAINTPTIGFDRILMQSDLAKAIGNINTGNIYSGINATANIAKTSGSTFKEGANYVNNLSDPHDTDDPLESTVIFVNAYRDGLGKLNFAGPTSTVSGSNYDDGTGILATVPSNKFTNQRAFYFPTTERTFIAYGQTIYGSLSEAVLAASTESFDIPAIYTEGSSQRAVLSIRNNFSTFTDPVSDGTSYKITPLGKFGEISSGSIATSIDLQAAYVNSALPQITTALGLPLQIKSGTGDDSDTVFEILNNAGTLVASFDALGNLIAVLPLHASTHQFGGTDPVNVNNLPGVLADNQSVNTDATITGDGTSGNPLSVVASASFDIDINQSSHGLSVDDAIYLNGSTFTKGLATSASTSGIVGVVTAVADVNNFTYTFGGEISGTYTDGTAYFLSNSAAGDIVTEPTYSIGHVRQFIGTGTPDGLLLEIDLGDEITETTGGGGISEEQAFKNYLSSKEVFQYNLDFTPAATFSGHPWFGSSITENEKYIILVFNDTAGGNYKDQRVVRYNKGTGRIDEVTITTTNAYSGDGHKLPSVLITKAGTLLIVIEQLNATGGSTHNSPFDVFRWTDLNDLSTYSQITTNLTSSGSYPFIFEVGTDIYIEFRYGLSSSDHYRRAYYKSTNDGASWAVASIWLDYTDTDYWMYSTQVGSNIKDRNNVYLSILAQNDESNANANQFVSFLKTNFTNFYKLDGTDLGTSVDALELKSAVVWGDTIKNLDVYSLHHARLFGDYIYGIGYIGTSTSTVVTYTDQQIFKVNINTGVVTTGSSFTNVFSDAWAPVLFEMGGDIYIRTAEAGTDMKYYKIDSDLNGLTHVLTEPGNHSVYTTTNLYNDLQLDFDTVTKRIRVIKL